MEYILGVQIRLPKNIAKKIKSIQKTNKVGYRGNYTVEPHITLHLTRYRREAFEKLCADLKSRSWEPFELTIKGLGSELNKEHGEAFYYVDLRKSNRLYRFHIKLLDITNAFREGLIRAKDEKRIKEGKVVGLKKNYTLKYGYSRVRKLFSSHITLGETDLSDKMNHSGKLEVRLGKALESLIGKKIPVDYIIVGLYRFRKDKNKYISISRCRVNLKK